MIYYHKDFKKFIRFNSILLIILFLFISSFLSNFSFNIKEYNYNYNQNTSQITNEYSTEIFDLESYAKQIVTIQTRGNNSNITPPKVTNESVAYAIICPSNLTEVIELLASWKTVKGVPAKIFTTDGPSGIYSHYPDGDNASKIHNFLTDLHKNNSNLQWVLLVGDEEIIPSRLIFVNASDPYGLDDYYYSDHYYAGLNNSWDQNNNGKYGEQKGDIDWKADLYVGRLPVNNVTEARVALNKVIKYEIDPEIGAWMNNATFWSGLLDAPNNKSAYQSYKDNAIKVTNKIFSHVPEHMNITHLYDYNELEGGNYSLDNDILTHNSAKQNFYSGHALLNFAGQAYYIGDELAHYFDDTGMIGIPDGFGALFSYNDAKYAYNGNKLPLVYLSTCSVNFSELDDSNLEQLITAPGGGAIGLIANSGKSYRGEVEDGSSYGNWWLDEHFWRLFFDGYVQPGECLYKLKEKYNLEVIYPGVPYIRMAVANLVGYNLLGDPEINIWTNIPDNLKINTSMVFDETHTLKFLVTNESGVPVENARVCVYNNETYIYNTTNNTGIVIFDLDPRLTGRLEATITAHNFLPTSLQFSYENQPPRIIDLPDITLDEDTVLDNYIELKEYITDPDNLFDDLDIYIFKNTDRRVGVRLDVYNRLDFRPFSNWNGKSEVTIQVSDGIAIVEDTFTVIVNPINDPPRIIYLIPDQRIKVGKTLEYQVIAIDIENDTLGYHDNTELFEIDETTGFIKFKPKEGDIGKHKVKITVSDDENSSYQSFIVEVYGDATQSVIDQYWFPITILFVMIIIIVFILILSKSKPQKPDNKETNKKKSSKSELKKGKKIKK